jgi:sugar lactone lactonase YvrE|uniref:Peptidylamidoglycolate lyase n=1 Tax=Haptolina ericina TaxID=156174 RepID=A0A7S3B2E5_9EUKA|mmetsp:Transcript_45576/g.102730  ORF Transcript_45576/g.102730 Transcript_45576/m.102730 type:complete len:159 (+) Transcript_45576:125-601(+)
MSCAGGVLYVADTHNHRIALFDTDPFLTWRGSFGRRGDAPGEFINPNGIALYGDECFVSDRRNNRIQVLALDGTFLRLFASPARSRGGRGPRDLTIDANGRLFVVEADTVAILTCAGEVLQLLVLPGSERLTGITLSVSRAFVTECERAALHVLELCS